MVEYDWDEEKNRLNLAKHAISFPIAMLVFDDPYWCGWQDRSMDYGEVRRIAVGHVGSRLVSVIYTERQEKIRIISARRASPHERRIYEEDRR